MEELKVYTTIQNSYLQKIAEKIKCSIKSLRISIEKVNSYENRYLEGKFTLRYKTVKKNQIIAQFSLVNMPGCCGVVISTGSLVTAPYRNKGIGTILNAMRQQIAFNWNYGLIVCTDIETNINQQKVLKNNNWTKNLSFKNPRTNNVVLMHSKILIDSKVQLGFVCAYCRRSSIKKKKKLHQ